MSEPQPPQPLHPNSVATPVFVACGETPAIDMNVDGAGAAIRRRERRLRAMLGHERQTVAVEIAAALHHSWDARPTWRTKLHSGQKTASSGSRPAPLSGVAGPHVWLVAPPSPSPGDAPSLSMPVLECRASEAVDSSTLSHILAQSLKEQKKVAEEKEKVLKAKEEEEPDRWVQNVDGASKTCY